MKNEMFIRYLKLFDYDLEQILDRSRDVQSYANDVLNQIREIQKEIEHENDVKKKREGTIPWRIREANQHDRYFLWLLANENEITKWSFRNRQVEWEEHVNWFADMLYSLSKYCYIIETVRGEPMGCVRFMESDDDCYVISIGLMPEYRGKGYARDIILSGVSKVFEASGCTLYYAYIMKGNEPSKRVFLKAGFETVATTEDQIIKRLVFDGAANEEFKNEMKGRSNE